MQFLMGLNEPYSQIRGSILMMNPLPDTRRTHGLILQQERQMEVAACNSIVPASHAMQVARREGSQTVTSFGNRKFCTHCEQGGHLVDQCYYLIGFPIGHKWHNKNMKPRNKKTTINNIEMKRESTDESPTFTTEEYKQIMALLKNGNNQPFANATGIAIPNCDNFNTHSALYWIVDSGATNHVSQLPPTHNKKKLIHDFVGLPNGEQTRINSIGSIQLSSDLSLDGVLHVPNFRVNLISVSKLTRALRCIVIFYPNFCVVQDVDTRRMIGLGKHFNGLYYLTPAQNPCLINHITCTSNLWHQRLGHPSTAPLHHLSQSFPDIVFNNKHVCEICPLAKQTRLSFPTRLINTIAPFDLVHCDVWGPHKIHTHFGARYFLTIVDDFTRFTWVHLMSLKSNTQSLIKSFFFWVKTQFDRDIKILRADNGGEFTSLRSFLDERGTIFQHTCAYTPQQNGVVERKHRHLLNVA